VIMRLNVPRKVVLVELSVYDRMLPLVSGYLRAYASRDAQIEREFDFTFYSAGLRKSREDVLADLLAERAAIYGFSCYAWNARWVKWLADQIKARCPDSSIVLGGPQVVGQFKYLNRQSNGMFLCNGEGERVFANFLRECTQGSPRFERVKGLSFYWDGEAVTTDSEPSFRHLDEIPSPFLAGYFPADRYTYTTFETNRGCPFACTFCYYGLRNDRVSKFSQDDRIFAELEWISRSEIHAVYIADANFGMLKRDVQIAEYLAKLKRDNGFPYMVIFNSAKNNPESVVKIAGIVQSAGMSATQSIAVQSLDGQVLGNIKRSNIKLAAYAQAQRELDRAGAGTFNEVIWPLPGETYESFCRGIDELVVAGAQSFLVHPLLLLQNTEMERRRAEHGFVTTETENGAAEYELVIGTNEVNQTEHDRGLIFIHAVNALFNARCAYFLIRYLRSELKVTFADLGMAFVDYCERNLQEKYVGMVNSAISERRYGEHIYWGSHFHYLAHECRNEFNDFLAAFARAQRWWSDDIQTVMELDRINRPFVYSNTPMSAREEFQHLGVTSSDRGYEVEIPLRWRSLVSALVDRENGEWSAERFLVDHERGQMPYMERESVERNATYCHGAFLRVSSLHPIWTPVVSGSEVAREFQVQRSGA